MFLIVSAPASAHADDRASSRIPDRGAFLVSFENLAGVTYDGLENRRALSHVGLGSTLGPRIGVYGVFGGGVTLGGMLSTLALYEEGRSRGMAVFIGPRAGYWFSSDVVGLWPRAGVNLVAAGRSGYIGYAFELPMTIRITEHALMLVGPSVEGGTGESSSRKYLNVSLTAGLMGAF
jgi:hypothetical protein